MNAFDRYNNKRFDASVERIGLESFKFEFEGRELVMVKDFVWPAKLSEIVFVSRPGLPRIFKVGMAVASIIVVAVLSVFVPPLFEESPRGVQSYCCSKQNHPFVLESDFPMQLCPLGMVEVAIFLFWCDAMRSCPPSFIAPCSPGLPDPSAIFVCKFSY